MNIKFQNIDRGILPLFYKLIGEHGNHELYILKAVGRGIQLIKADSIMLQLLAQH